MKPGYHILIILLFVISVSRKNVEIVPDTLVQNQLQRLQKQSDSFLVDSIHQIDFDEVYILKPYLTEDGYHALKNKISHLPWTGWAAFSADWFIYLVFSRHGTAIEFLQMERFPCDLTYVGNSSNPAFLKKGTLLYVNREPGGRIIIYNKSK